ncbi:MAG: imidazole glycerol phosphate synthase subunit HisH [Gemmatimonadales bacterium]|nr:MAG: imidazole glycerol phosphate synthase subunit HisH [Gemmatimonadales bacterium]
MSTGSSDTPHVALFDYGAGNLHSLAKGLEAGGGRVTITTDWDEALGLDALVLPGVGSFGAASQALAGHEARVREALAGGYPALGICLGMQLLLSESEEGEGGGVGLVPGRVRRLRARTVPQMGWNDVVARDMGDPVSGSLDGESVYYANSFVCEPDDPGVVTATSTVEGDTFAAALRTARSWGVQFHPEKSSTPGLALLRRFLHEVAS